MESCVVVAVGVDIVWARGEAIPKAEASDASRTATQATTSIRDDFGVNEIAMIVFVVDALSRVS